MADLVLVVLDRSRPLTATIARCSTRRAATARIVVANKSDLPPAWDASSDRAEPCRCRRRPATGSTQLRDAIVACARRPRADARHAGGHERAPRRLLERARDALRARAGGRAAAAVPEEFVARRPPARRADALEEITGARTADDMLHAIFEFCIGK